MSAITDASGAVLESRSFKPFGSPEQEWSEDSVINGFTGHEHDTDLGLVNMRGRIYDPVVGRFLTADPFVTNPLRPQGWNRYAYVENNPLNYTDPSGFYNAPVRERDQYQDPSPDGSQTATPSQNGSGRPNYVNGAGGPPGDIGGGGSNTTPQGPPGADGGRGGPPPGSQPSGFGHNGPSTISNLNGFPMTGNPPPGTSPPAAGIGSDQTQQPPVDGTFDKRRGHFIGQSPAQLCARAPAECVLAVEVGLFGLLQATAEAAVVASNAAIIVVASFLVQRDTSDTSVNIKGEGKQLDRVAKDLNIPREALRKAIETIKKAGGLRGADNVDIMPDGTVIDRASGDPIGNVYDEQEK